MVRMSNKVRAALAASALAASAASPSFAADGIFGANLATPAGGTHATLYFVPADGKSVRVLGLAGVTVGGDAHPRAVIVDAQALTWAVGPVTLVDPLGASSSTAQSGTVTTANLPAGVRHFLQGGFPFGGFELPAGKALLVFGDAGVPVSYSLLFDEE